MFIVSLAYELVEVNTLIADYNYELVMMILVN